MTEKKTSKASKLKNFLVTGSVEEKAEEGAAATTPQYDPAVQEDLPEYVERPEKEEVVIEDIIIGEAVIPEPKYERDPFQGPAWAEGRRGLEDEVAELREMVSGLISELGKYTTSKEQLKEYSSILSKRDSELADKKFMRMLEQLSAMREDFFKLCSGINAKLDSFSPKDVLGSFEAYGVDMENILVDCGVQIGPSKFEKLNTIHQRIVDVIPTGDESMNGMIAERVSDGYVYQGRVLQKEKVKIYKFSENERTEGDEQR